MRTTEVMNMTLTRESMVLIAICALDLIVTLFLLTGNAAVEGNPLMAFFLDYGLGTFIMMKITLTSIPVFIFEWCRQYRPAFVSRMLRATIVLYVGIYASLFLVVNLGI